MRRIFRLLLAGCVLSPLLSAHAADPQDFRVMHAEAITARARDLAPPAPGQSVTRLSFQAYGRQFDLALESNARLLTSLPARLRKSFARYPLFKGTIAGRSDSWVRLTRIGDELHGAFWDGTHLYTVAPAKDVAPYVLQSLDASGTDPVVYRLADTQSVLDTEFCAVSHEHAAASAADAPAAGYQKVLDGIERQFEIAAAALEQLEIAFIADTEFSGRFPSDTQGAMLARVNIIDGIFDGQVGVAIVPDFVVFTGSTDPFVSTDASTLLDEVGRYRQSTPAVRAAGLAHLMTGRSLDGNTAGVAFLDALCANFAGVGLSQNTSSTMISALIAAHEIGHNFGAPHDAESGSACASTPGTFLMNPQINGSSTFSQCSLDRMRPNITAASCITPVASADAALSVPGGTINALSGTPFDVALDVNSMGTATVNAVVLTASPANLSVESATFPQGTCTTGANSVVTCNIGAIPATASRRITLRLRGTALGSAQVGVSLDSSNDANAQNDEGTVQISVNAQAPAPPPPGGGGDDDDGGGSLGLLSLLTLALVVRRRAVLPGHSR